MIFFDMPYNLITFILGAFLLGWILASVNARLGHRRHRRRDLRDDRIRSLEADLRVAQTNAEQAREQLARIASKLDGANDGIGKREQIISQQQSRIDELERDLRESVEKTCELRAALTERANENMRSQARLREVETELSVAIASTDLIATGVLDYSLSQDAAATDSEAGAVET